MSFVYVCVRERERGDVWMGWPILAWSDRGGLLGALALEVHSQYTREGERERETERQRRRMKKNEGRRLERDRDRKREETHKERESEENSYHQMEEAS